MGGLLFLLALAYGHQARPTPHLEGEVWRGRGWVEIETVRPVRSLFADGWNLSGKLVAFVREGEPAPHPALHHLPVTLFLPISCQLPRFDCDYLVDGELVEERGRYRIRWDKEAPWHSVAGSFSLEESRLRLRHWLRSKMERGGELATSLVLGEVGEFATRLDFGRLGLQHLMAVSGFHFSIVAFALFLLIRPLLPPPFAAIAVALLLTTYLWVIGSGAAGQRAWMMALTALLAKELGRPYSGLNALGGALLLVLLLDPRAVESIGFQLSFGATGAILLFNRPVERLLERLFPRRPLPELVQMAPLDQHGYLAATLLRRSLALMIAVHLAVLPLTLALFHRFPLLSLLYNLAIPPLVGGVILLSIGGLLFPPLLGLVKALSLFILNAVHYPPTFFSFTLRVDGVPYVFLLLWFVLLLGVGILLWEKQRDCYSPD